MSSLRDIMDVDVEPLPQSLRKPTREHTTPDETTADQLNPSSTNEPYRDDQGKASIKRRKSSRPGQTSPSETSSTQGESSTAAASMDPNQYGPGSHRHTSGPSSTRHSSRGSDVPEGTVKYTPVTGRVSRAKKGQPVHVCDICKPSKTFTRAEHLRRHQLSHTKPAYPCTFQDCERAFHRPDLLARHKARHDTGEQPYKGTKARSRASSADSSSRLGTPLLKPEDQSKPSSASPSESMNPRASAAATAPTSANLSPPYTSAKIESPSPAGEQSYPVGRQNDTAHGDPTAHMGEHFRGSVPQASDDMLSQYHLPPRNMNNGFYNEQSLFHIPTNFSYGPYPTADDFTSNLQLQIPEQPYPGLCMQDNGSSPWYGSESPYSTPSDRTGRSWGEYRDRSVSIATVPDVGYAQPPWSPHRASSAQRNSIHSRSPNMGSLSEVPDELSYLPASTLAASQQMGYAVAESGSGVLLGHPAIGWEDNMWDSNIQRPWSR